MIIVMTPGATKEEIKKVVKHIKRLGFEEHISKGKETTIIGVVGDERGLDGSRFSLLKGVDRVIPILKPFRLASRDYKKTDTIIDIGGIKIGEGSFTVMAGPCAIESAEQILKTASRIKQLGAVVLRGGAFKPRTSPYSFQGLGEDGLDILKTVKKKTGLLTVTEVVSAEDMQVVSQFADIMQIGARNMQNFRLLEAVGNQPKPVLLKRGIMATIEEFLLAAEYILSFGNRNVILCERGIRTFEKYTRNTLDISAVPVIKKLSHLPIIIDPSHACGHRDYVCALAKAAVAVGADGLLIEVHPEPEKALSDGQQSLDLAQFASLMKGIKSLVRVIGKKFNKL